MEDGRCLLDVINDESALTDFLSKDFPTASPGGTSNGGLRASQQLKTGIPILPAHTVQVPALLKDNLQDVQTTAQLPASIQLPVTTTNFHHGVINGPNIITSSSQSIDLQNIASIDQSNVQLLNVKNSANIGNAGRPVKILPQQRTIAVNPAVSSNISLNKGNIDQQQGSPILSGITTSNVNNQLIGQPQQGVTLVPKTGNGGNSVNFLANLPGMSQPVALQGTVIQTATGSKILIQGNQLGGQTLGGHSIGGQTLSAAGQPQVAIRPQPTTTLPTTSATTVQALPQLAIRPQSNTIPGGLNIQTVAAGQPTVKLANFGSPAHQVVVQRGLSPGLFVRTLPSNAVQYQSVNPNGNVSNFQPQPQFQALNGQQVVSQNGPVAPPINQASVTLSIAQGVNLQSLQGLNLEQLKKIPGVTVISNKRPVQPKLAPLTSIAVSTTSLQAVTSSVSSNMATVGINLGNQGGLIKSQMNPSLDNDANKPFVVSNPVKVSTGQARPIFPSPSTEQISSANDNRNTVSPVNVTGAGKLQTVQVTTQVQQTLQKIQMQLKQLNAVPNPTPEQTNLIQQLVAVRHKFLLHAKNSATQNSASVQSTVVGDASGDILTSLLGKAEKPFGNGSVTTSPGSKLPFSSSQPQTGASGVPPLLTQIKVGNQTFSINLKPEQKEKIQNQLSKLSPEQQQLFYKHQQALILKFHQQKKEGTSSAQKPHIINVGKPNQLPTVVHQQNEKRATEIRPSNVQVLKPGTSRTKRAPVVPNTPANRGTIILRQLTKDQENVVTPDCATPFRTRQEACKRLLRYHIYNTKNTPEQVLEKSDGVYEDMCSDLIDRKNKLLEKYRTLLWQDSMRHVPSPETVLVQRLLHTDIKNKLEQEKNLPQGETDEILSNLPETSTPSSQVETEQFNSETEIDVTSDVTPQGENLSSFIMGTKNTEKGPASLDGDASCGKSSPRLVVKIKRHGTTVEDSNMEAYNTSLETDYTSHPKRTKYDDGNDNLKLKLKVGHTDIVTTHIPKLKISLKHGNENSMDSLNNSDLDFSESIANDEREAEHVLEVHDGGQELKSTDDAEDVTDDEMNNRKSATKMINLTKQPVYSDISDAEDASVDEQTDNSDDDQSDSLASQSFSHSLNVEQDSLPYSSYSFQMDPENEREPSAFLDQPDIMDYDSRESVGFSQSMQDSLNTSPPYQYGKEELGSCDSAVDDGTCSEPAEVESAIKSILGFQGEDDPSGDLGLDDDFVTGDIELSDNGIAEADEDIKAESPQDDLDAAVQSILM